MIRVVLFLIVVGALALGVAWLADRPGDVVVTWQGLRIETSLMVLGAAMLAAMAVAGAALERCSAPSCARRSCCATSAPPPRRARLRGDLAAGSSPSAPANRRRAQAHRRGQPDRARRAARAAAERAIGAACRRPRRAPSAPSAPWRAAPTPRRSACTACSSRRSAATISPARMRLPRRRRATARRSAGPAGRCSNSAAPPAIGPARWRCSKRNKRALDKESYRRQRAVLLTARALAVGGHRPRQRQGFRARSGQARADAGAGGGARRPPARRGRRTAQGVAHRRQGVARQSASRTRRRTYAELRFGDAARDRLKRIEALAKKVPGHIEGALAMARAALDAREFAKARAALAPYLAAPTKRVALLMAELERAERNDEGRAREWMARALNAAPDPAWTADGYVSDRWLPVSPVSGRLDAFEWRVPLTGIARRAPVIEPEPAGRCTPIEIARRAESAADRPAAGVARRLPRSSRGDHAAPAPAGIGAAETRAGHPARPRARRSGPRWRRGERTAGGTAGRRLAEDFRAKRRMPQPSASRLVNVVRDFCIIHACTIMHEVLATVADSQNQARRKPAPPRRADAAPRPHSSPPSAARCGAIAPSAA